MSKVGIRDDSLSFDILRLGILRFCGFRPKKTKVTVIFATAEEEHFQSGVARWPTSARGRAAAG